MKKVFVGRGIVILILILLICALIIPRSNTRNAEVVFLLIILTLLIKMKYMSLFNQKNYHLK